MNIVVPCLALFAGAGREQETEAMETSKLLGMVAPNLTCKTTDGRVSNLARYFQNGKPTLLCFYVPWSGPCRLASIELVRGRCVCVLLGGYLL